MDTKNNEFIPVTIDKSHIITIGERLYTESIEFIREIVNNAYDADATLVDINITEDSIEIKDNGTGMDREGLQQYFNIGSQQKLYAPKSPIYGRDRIGQFGIGKFATLSACKRFVIITKNGDFVGKVTFDKEEWEKAENIWQLPLEILPPDAREADGTTVILEGLTKKFDPRDIEAKIIEGTPLKAPNFTVRLNRHTITPRSLTAHRLPFLEGTPFGPVTGEIIILPETAASTKDMGIEVKVKQVTIRREFFGMETWGKSMARVTGEVHADFLPNAVIKRMRFGEIGISCCVDSFGEDGPEVFSEETTIYINREHPLYKRESKKMDTHVLNLARLITQEISLMKDPKNPRQAFERQSKLLRDAFIEKNS